MLLHRRNKMLVIANIIKIPLLLLPFWTPTVFGGRQQDTPGNGGRGAFGGSSMIFYSNMLQQMLLNAFKSSKLIPDIIDSAPQEQLMVRKEK